MTAARCDRWFAAPVEQCGIELGHAGPCCRPGTVHPAPVFCLACRFTHGPIPGGCPSGAGRDLDNAPRT